MSRERSASEPAGERWIWRTTRTLESAPQTAFSLNPVTVTPEMHWIVRGQEEIDGYPPRARCSPANLKTVTARIFVNDLAGRSANGFS
jgi:hypothetical protein